MNDIQIKGPSLNYLVSFIKENFKERYDEWFNELNDESKTIFGDIIMSTKWYDLNNSHIHGIKKMGDVFYEGDFFQAAYDLGKYGGKKALSGIYKIFVKFHKVVNDNLFII